MRFSILQQTAARDDGDSGASVLEQLERSEAKAVESFSWYPRAFQFVRHISGQVGNGEISDLSQGELLAKEIVELHLQGNLPQQLLVQVLHSEEEESFLLANMVNVAVYSVLVGSILGLSRETLVELGLAGLLRDIGHPAARDRVGTQRIDRQRAPRAAVPYLADDRAEPGGAADHDDFVARRSLGGPERAQVANRRRIDGRIERRPRPLAGVRRRVAAGPPD